MVIFMLKILKWSEALQEYENAIMIDQEYTEAYMEKAFIYIKLNQLEEAFQHFTKIQEFNPDLKKFIFTKKIKKFKEAFNELKKLLETNRNNLGAYIQLGIIYRKYSKIEQACYMYEKGFELYEPQKPIYEHLYQQGSEAYVKRKFMIALIEKGDYQKEIQIYNQIRDQSSNVNQAKDYKNKAIAYKGIGKIQQAFEDFSRALELNPELKKGYMARGIIYIELNKIPEAIEDFSKAIQLDHKFEAAYHKREMNQLQQGLAEISKAIELNPNFSLAYCDRGLIYNALGQTKEALEDANIALEFELKSAYAYCTKNIRDRGIIYKTAGKAPEAFDDYKKALGLSKLHKQTYLNRGILYYSMNDLNEALQEIQKAIELDKCFADAFFNVNLSFIQKDQFTKR